MRTMHFDLPLSNHRFIFFALRNVTIKACVYDRRSRLRIMNALFVKKTKVKSNNERSSKICMFCIINGCFIICVKYRRKDRKIELINNFFSVYWYYPIFKNIFSHIDVSWNIQHKFRYIQSSCDFPEYGQLPIWNSKNFIRRFRKGIRLDRKLGDLNRFTKLSNRLQIHTTLA